ncbi:MAG: SulP family inorganic anion transporter [Bacteroidota bacterium]
MFSKIKSDLPASLVVFLVALPLCLGVALASGAPLLSGIISGIIGGVVVGILSESHTSVSGPAAGLAAVVLSAITQLQSFEIFLLAVVLAGVFQLIMGIFKTGFVANYIPSNVIKGLLAAIGIILILKQIPHAIGFDKNNENDFSFFQHDGENTFSALKHVYTHFSIGVVILSGLSLLVLINWDKTPLKKYSFFPASLFVVFLGIFMNFIYQRFFPQLYIDQSHLVNIPKFDGISSLIKLPSFENIGNYQVWVIALTIALVASLETLLNLEAVENIDPHKRQASPNRELVAQGIGNICAGLIGGLPITSVIVRSSVNIHAGAQTKISTIIHGLFLFSSIVFIGSLLNLIPLASLATILIVTGYKLAKKELFMSMYKKGLNQFIPFLATIVFIIFTDLLIGIAIGLVISIFYLLKSNYQNPFKLEKETIHLGETVRLELPNQVSFLNKATIKDTLWDLPKNSKVVIDATYSDFIDNDILEILEDFKKTVSVEKGIQANILGLKEKYDLHDHVQFINVLDKETQQKLTPAEILEVLKQGNERFIKGRWTEKYFKHQVNATSFGQNPMVTIVSCIDSRISPELIFDAGLGDLISIRIAGNIVSKEIIGSIELACKEIGTKLIIILGHSNCGAVSSAIHSIRDGHISHITDKIERAISQCNCSRDRILEDVNTLNSVIKNNVQNSIDEILLESSYLNKRINSSELSIVPAFYDTVTGVVSFETEEH